MRPLEKKKTDFELPYATFLEQTFKDQISRDDEDTHHQAPQTRLSRRLDSVGFTADDSTLP